MYIQFKASLFAFFKRFYKLKETAKQHHQITLQLQAVFFEKKIEALHITRSISNRAEQLSKESDAIAQHLLLVNQLSNLSLSLYSWYINNGHARNQLDVNAIKEFFEKNLPIIQNDELTFYEKLYLYQSYCWCK